MSCDYTTLLNIDNVQVVNLKPEGGDDSYWVERRQRGLKKRGLPLNSMPTVFD
jgi:hypothetical protein